MRLTSPSPSPSSSSSRPGCAAASKGAGSRPGGTRGGGRAAALALAAALPLLLTLAGCGGGVLDPQGPIGGANRTILLNSLVIMLAIVVPTIVVALVFPWWYR